MFTHLGNVPLFKEISSLENFLLRKTVSFDGGLEPLDVLHQLKVAGKRDPEQEREAQAWIESVIGQRFPAVPYELALRDGIILCQLMNRLQPGIISKINVSGGDYKMMDNLSQFQNACVRYGVPDVDLFQTTDLWDQKNIALVTTTIFAIGRTCYKHPEAGEGMIGLQAGSNKGATQAGQNFGASRKIILGK
ncbi:hypothetical protein YQE_03488, partial [Dendroctonus ponderosae]